MDQKHMGFDLRRQPQIEEGGKCCIQAMTNATNNQIDKDKEKLPRVVRKGQ